MECKEKKEIFKNSLSVIKEELNGEIKKITDRTNERAKELADSSEDDNNLAEGIGIAAGTAIGSYLGGSAGGAVGATVGKEIGKLFEVEIYNREVSIEFDLPQATMKDESLKFDLPEVTMKDDDIIFDSIVIEMVPQKVGETPHVKCTSPTLRKPVPKCTVKWTPNYVDVPVPKKKEVRIVLSMPEISMRTKEIIVSIPEISMRTQEIIIKVPSVTIKSKKDIGKELSAKANELVTESELLVKEKKEIIRTKIKMEVIPKAKDMFTCFRDSILNKRAVVSSSFDPSIEVINQSLLNLKSKGVPETDNDYVNLKNQLNQLVAQREVSLKSFDDSLKKLDEDMKASLKSLVEL